MQTHFDGTHVPGGGAVHSITTGLTHCSKFDLPQHLKAFALARPVQVAPVIQVQ
jgi:hypothetical protein